jgi:hypothetical protein
MLTKLKYVVKICSEKQKYKVVEKLLPPGPESWFFTVGLEPGPAPTRQVQHFSAITLSVITLFK